MPSNLIDVKGDTMSLTEREEKGFQFEAEISDLLTLLKIQHDEFPHLFRNDFKHRVGQGVDFKLNVNGYSIMVECKDWDFTSPSWLHNVIDRFVGKSSNYGTYNICVVRKKYSSRFYRYKHIPKKYSIMLMSDYEFYAFLLKQLRKGTKKYNIKKYVNGRFVSKNCHVVSFNEVETDVGTKKDEGDYEKYSGQPVNTLDIKKRLESIKYSAERLALSDKVVRVWTEDIPDTVLPRIRLYEEAN